MSLRNSHESSLRMPADVDWSMLDKTRFFLLGAGLFSGVSALFYPMVVVKTRQQVLPGCSSAIATARAILATDGPRGFYRGFATSLLGTLPARALYMSTLELTKSNVSAASAQLAGLSDHSAAALGSAAGGLSAAVAAQLVWTPVDVISQRLMVQDVQRPVVDAGQRHVQPGGGGQRAVNDGYAHPKDDRQRVVSCDQRQADSHRTSGQRHDHPGSTGGGLREVHVSQRVSDDQRSWAQRHYQPGSSGGSGCQRELNACQRHDQPGSGGGGGQREVNSGQRHDQPGSSGGQREVNGGQRRDQPGSGVSGQREVNSGQRHGQSGSPGGQRQRLHSYKGGLDALRHIARTDGMKGLYRGFGVSILTYAPSNAVWWASYCVAQRSIWGQLGHTEAAPLAAVMAVQAISAAAAGGAAALVTTPLDTVKTRLQVLDAADSSAGGRPPSVSHTLRLLLLDGGWKAFYRGLGPRWASMSMSATTMITAYEFLKRASAKPPKAETAAIA